MEESEFLQEGVCHGCGCKVMLAYAVHLETRQETKKCLNCGQAYTRSPNWQKVEDKEE